MRPHPPRSNPYRLHAATLAVIIVLSLGTGLAMSPDAAANTLGARLEGHITQSDGTGLADVSIVLKKQVAGSLWHLHEASTDPSGAYDLEGVEPGTWNLSIRKDGYQSQHHEITMQPNGSLTHDAVLQPLFETHYRGSVSDRETGQPIEGAEVRLRSWGWDSRDERTTLTGSDGTFQIALFYGENDITITKKGYTSYHDWAYNAQGDIERTIQLSPVPPQTAKVEGRVIDAATGQGVQARVSMWTDWSRSSDDREGGYAEPMPMPEAGIAYSGDMADDYWYPGHGSNHNQTITLTDGRFTMDAYPGPVVVEANRADYLVARKNVELTENGVTQVTFELVALPERSVTITGTVTNAQNGSAIAGASVNAQVPAAGDYEWTRTDENGHFELHLRPGYTMIDVSHWNHGWYDVAVDTLEYHVADEAVTEQADPAPGTTDPDEGTASHSSVPPRASREQRDTTRYYPAVRTLTTEPESTHSLQIGLHPEREPTTTIIGYVVDEDDQGVAGARVYLNNHETGAWGSAVTDEHGSFRFQTHAGYHTIGAHASGFLPAGTNTIAPASGTHRVDVHVVAGEWANAGWWRPGDEDHGRAYPMPEPAYETAEAMDRSATAGAPGAVDEMAIGEGSFGMDGNSGLQGGPGGLGPYQAMGTPNEAPAPAVLLVLLGVLAALGIARRRRRC